MSKKDINFVKFIKPQVEERKREDKDNSNRERVNKFQRRLLGGLS